MDIKRLREQRKIFYDSIGSVYCPILQEKVYFNSDGFEHLIYRPNRQPRNIDESYMKLMCLIHAPITVRECKVITETRKIRRKIKGKYKNGIRHELVHEIRKGVKMRVVVEKIGTGNNNFLSIMPHTNSSKPKKRPKRRS